MQLYVSVLLLALAVSLDSFGAGLNYGLRNIKIPIGSILIIALCSGGMILVSMLLGSLLAPVLPKEIATVTGGGILMIIGAWAFVQMWRQQRTGTKEESQVLMAVQSVESRRLLHIELRSIGLVIEILRTPSRADVDRSGTISASEAALLGAALSLDAFGAGIGAAFIGLSPWLTAPVIALFSAGFLWFGIGTGKLCANQQWMKKLSFLPGLILIVLGLSKLLY